MPSLDIDPSLRIPAHEAERSQLLESIRSGSLLLVPSLNDPNATSPLEDMGFSSGLISTNELFQEELISVVNENAPESISQGYSGLFYSLEYGDHNSISEGLTAKENYADFLKIITYLSTGKLATQQEINKTIKLTKSLNEISIEDKLITIPAILSGFAISEGSNSKDGKNSKRDLTSFTNLLLSGDFNGTYSPLCAQYMTLANTAGASENHLREHIATDHASRTMEWQSSLLFISKLKNPEIKSTWATLVGDSLHIQSIIPTVILKYGAENQLGKMLMLIDRHSSELQNLADNLDHSVEIQDLASVETATEELLKNIFGNWYQIQEQDLHQLKSDLLATQPRDNHQEILLQIVNISLEAYPEQARFYQDTQALAEHFSQEVIDVSDDLQNMPEEDLLEWASYRHWSGDLPEIQEQATHFLEQVYSAIYNQGLITTAARTVHEVVLYYFLGKHAAENKKLVIGLDLDHNSWMDQSWKLGYNYDHQDNSTLAQDQPTGILYARKPDITLTDEEADLSPVQVYLNRYQYNQEGSQSLSNFWLREEWDLNHSH